MWHAPAPGTVSAAGSTLIPLITACQRVPPNMVFVTPKYVENASRAAARDPTARPPPALVDVAGVPSVDAAEWAAWLEAVPPKRVSAKLFAEKHGVPEQQVLALLRANAIEGTEHKRSGVTVVEHQPLVNPEKLISLVDAAAARGGVAPEVLLSLPGAPATLTVKEDKVGASGCVACPCAVDCTCVHTSGGGSRLVCAHTDCSSPPLHRVMGRLRCAVGLSHGAVPPPRALRWLAP
jgi:hypothetical protein